MSMVGVLEETWRVAVISRKVFFPDKGRQVRRNRSDSKQAECGGDEWSSSSFLSASKRYA